MDGRCQTRPGVVSRVELEDTQWRHRIRDLTLNVTEIAVVLVYIVLGVRNGNVSYESGTLLGEVDRPNQLEREIRRAGRGVLATPGVNENLPRVVRHLFM